MQCFVVVFEVEPAQRVHHRRGILRQQLPRHQAGQHQGDADVENGGDDQRGNDADGDIALGIFAFFGCGGDRVEADIGKENDGAAGQDA